MFNMLVQCRLALYTILISLLKLASCRAVFASNNAQLTGWWNAVLRLIEMLVSQWCGGTRSPSANFVIYQTALEVDLWCRLFSVGNVSLVCSPTKAVRRTPCHPLASLNPVSDESLDPDDHPVRICSPQLSITSSLKTNWLLEWLFHSNNSNDHPSPLTSQRTFCHWLTSWRHSLNRSLIGWRGCHSNN